MGKIQTSTRLQNCCNSFTQLNLSRHISGHFLVGTFHLDLSQLSKSLHLAANPPEYSLCPLHTLHTVGYQWVILFGYHLAFLKKKTKQTVALSLLLKLLHQTANPPEYSWGSSRVHTPLSQSGSSHLAAVLDFCSLCRRLSAQRIFACW